MFRRLALALVLVATLLPSAALASKPKHGVGMKVGQACSMRKQATYKAHHFKCVKGHLEKLKKSK